MKISLCGSGAGQIIGQLGKHRAPSALAMKLYILASAAATASAWVAPRSAAPRGLSVRAPPASRDLFFPPAQFETP